AAAVDALLRTAQEWPWPAPAAATFALARVARSASPAMRELLRQRQAALCELTTLRDAAARANVLSALAALAGGCADADPESFVGRGHAPAVRAAAQRWWFALDEASPARRAAQTRCLREALDSRLAATCAAPELPSLGPNADVFAYGLDGRTLLPRTLVALHLADGTVLVGSTDASGRLVVEDAPEGTLRLEDPLSTPLEP
ncbi:MAG: hypothetical protein AAF447_11515, partial [Myxococcota bacterium]